MDRLRVSTEICGRPSHICPWWKMSGFPIMTKTELGHWLQKDFIWRDTVLFMKDATRFFEKGTAISPCSDRKVTQWTEKTELIASRLNKTVSPFLVDKVHEVFWFTIQSECFNLLSLFFLCATRFCVIWSGVHFLACIIAHSVHTIFS